MVEFEKIETLVNHYLYEDLNLDKIEAFWSYIKKNPIYQVAASDIIRNDYNDGYTLRGVSIATLMLYDYASSDNYAYYKLINSIYSCTDIARLEREGESFLELTLDNENLYLADDQKEFAINEAMSQDGTRQNELYNSVLKYIDIDDTDRSLYKLYCNSYHGFGPYDIRYKILRSPIWEDADKQLLLYEFYNNDMYDEIIDTWEEDIIESKDNIGSMHGTPYKLTKETLYKYPRPFLEKLLTHHTQEICDEIDFTRKMHELRKTQEEMHRVKEYTKK